MLGDPIVIVECDDCGQTEELSLTSLAQRSWDMRGIGSQLRQMRWTEDGNAHYCDDCSERREDET